VRPRVGEHARGRAVLHRLVEKLPRLILITVNFDQLIEDKLSAPCQVIAEVSAFEDHRPLVVARGTGSDVVVPILKVHGTIERPETLIADINETSRGLPRAIVDTFDALLDATDTLPWV
jgi:hypothetical protein